MPKKTSKQTAKADGNAQASYVKKISGWRALILENEHLRVTALPEFGGWVVSIFNKKRSVELLWRSPRGLLAKSDPPVIVDPLLGYRSYAPGGWPELFPHGSAPAEVNGVKLPMHGEVHGRAWDCEVLEERGTEVSARLSVDCHLMPLRLERTLRLAADSATLVVEEKAINRSGLPVSFMWGHHPYYGKPLLDAGGASRIFAPAAKSLTTDYRPAGWPVHEGKDLGLCPPEGAGSGEMFYLAELSAGWYALVNPRQKLGIALSWDLKVFPFVWIWREANGNRNYPYFGGAYTVAIEPFSSLPGARERGERLLHLDGGKSLSTKICFTAFDGLTEVTGVSAEGKVEGK